MLTVIDTPFCSPDTAPAVRAMAWPHERGNVKDLPGYVPALEERPTR